MTNEELWLTLQLAKSLDTQRIDIVPRREPGDNILLSEDRTPIQMARGSFLDRNLSRARTCLRSPMPGEAEELRR